MSTGTVCEHGSLSRSCDLCDAQQTIEDRKATISAQASTIEALEARLAASEAGAAAMREALQAVQHKIACSMNNKACACGGLPMALGRIDAALATPAGAALLERLRKAEHLNGEYAKAIENLNRVVGRQMDEKDKRLRACQSLHRAWKFETAWGEAHATALRSTTEKVRAERDALRAKVERLKVKLVETESREAIGLEDGMALRAQVRTLESSYDLLQSMFHTGVTQLEDARARVEALRPLSEECSTAFAMAHDGVDNPQRCDEVGTTLCLACRLRAALAGKGD